MSTVNYRTDENRVASALEIDCNDKLWPHIETANALVNWVVAQDSPPNLQLSPELAEKVERYLAAHFYALKNPQLQSENTSKAGGTYQGQTGEGLQGTWWGRQALTLDTTGWLAQRDRDAQEGFRRTARMSGPRGPRRGRW